MVSCQASFFVFGDVGGAGALLGVADYGHGCVAVVNARHAVAADSPNSIIEGTDETHEGGGHLGVEGERRKGEISGPVGSVTFAQKAADSRASVTTGQRW